MANGDPLPGDDRVARGCLSGYDKEVITASAFDMRKIERPLRQISAEWVECPYAEAEDRNIEGAIARLKARGVRMPQPVAILPVLEIRAIERSRVSLNVIEYGSGSGPRGCHSAICRFTGTGAVDLELQQALADLANNNPVEWIK